jgi:hypothetical protein
LNKLYILVIWCLIEIKKHINNWFFTFIFNKHLMELAFSI